MSPSTNLIDPLPRELAPGLFWLGACFGMRHRGTMLHTYDSAFLLRGENACMLVEAGMPPDLDVVGHQLSGLLADAPPAEVRLGHTPGNPPRRRHRENPGRIPGRRIGG